jgi:hypothetical protein
MKTCGARPDASSCRRLAPVQKEPDMSFRYSHTFPISGPNKLPRFRQWAAENLPGIAFSLPPQVPVKSTALTVRLQSIEDRAVLTEKLAGAGFK